MFGKRLWIPIVIPLLFLMGTRLFSGEKLATEDPQRACRRVEVETTPKPLCEVSQTTAPASTDTRPPALPTSAVPGDLPASLTFPCALREMYHTTRDLSPCETRRLANLFRAIVRDDNPGRSRAALWSDFIAAEKAYRAHAAQALGEPLNTTLAGSRYDWQYEQAWAFPEIMECFVRETDPEKISRFVRAHQIAMGDLSVDHNRVHLLDGREFQMRPNIQYVFEYNYPDGVPVLLRDETVSTPGPPRPEVVIDVLNTSDADLKRLSGWDFRINPITLHPFEVPHP